jgi:predicted N-acetyltransferase YhbS
MTITNLKNAPELLTPTLALIEKAFHYSEGQHFNQDFAPLMAASNRQNCFIFLSENNEVIAHLGVKIREIQNLPVAMLGGIAVAEGARGQGVFNQLMTHVLSEFKEEVAFFLLWSDQTKLYTKYGFHLCGRQIELNPMGAQNTSFEATKYHLLSKKHQLQIQQLYTSSFSMQYKTFERKEENWKEIEEIRSTDLYIRKENDEITDYFFKNKGQDLNGIIFEYGSKKDIKKFIPEIRSFGTIWFGQEDFEGTDQFQFMLAPGSSKIFGGFIQNFTSNQILVRQINQIKNEIYFEFNHELLSLDIKEFLEGIFGPNSFQELNELPNLFISGLDSI